MTSDDKLISSKIKNNQPDGSHQGEHTASQNQMNQVEGSQQADHTKNGPGEQVRRRDAIRTAGKIASSAPSNLLTNSPQPGYLRTLESLTWQRHGWTVDELVAAKRGRTVSVVLPALNEEATVAAVVTAVRAAEPLVVPLADHPAVLHQHATDHRVGLDPASAVHREPDRAADEGFVGHV